MKKFKAKTIIQDEFWILTQGSLKVGQIKACGNNIEVQVNGKTVDDYKTLNDIKDFVEFIDMPAPDKTLSDIVHEYPTNCIAYNGVWNVKDSLPLYTQSPESKSWFAAGYYKLNINGNWVVQYCPKLITLQRNEYTGPFKTDPGFTTFNELFE